MAKRVKAGRKQKTTGKAPKRIGIVGFGFMGRMHYGYWKKQRGVKIVALCDSNLTQFAEGVEGGNLQGADNSTDYGDALLYDDFDCMLNEARLDAISLTLPTPLHLPLTVKALNAGVSVLCEKPMSLDAKSCKMMLNAAARAPKGTELMVAHCLRFWPCYTELKKYIDSGRYGRVIAASFNRYSAMPGWGKGENWFTDESKSGGVALDLHIHDTDMVNYLFGMPRSVTSQATYNDDGVMTFIKTAYDVGGAAVTSEGCWAMTQSYGFRAGYMLTFENAVVIMDTDSTDVMKVYPARGKPFTPRLKKGDGYEYEIAWFADKIRGRDVKAVTDATQSYDSVRIVDAEKRSAKSGRKVTLK